VLTKTLPGGTQLSYSYDAVGNLASFTDGGGKVSYSYDADNQLLTLTEPGGAQTTFVYNAGNERTSVSYPNGVVMTMSYDLAGHLVGITAKKGSTVLTSFSYSYQKTSGLGTIDVVNSATDNVSGNTTQNTYDTLNRLTEARGTNFPSDDKYQYNWAGNLTSATLGIGATPTTYGYNAANELTSSTHGSTTTTYTYDANGSETGWNQGGLSFSYNALNQTTAISGNNYSYSGSDQTDRVQSNNTSYVYSWNGLSSQTDSSGTTYYTRCSCAKGTLVDERTPSGTYYYLFDGLGSIVGLTDSNGTLVATYQYDPYGNLTSSTGSVTNPWRFAAGYFDSSTGLYKFGTRYYDPALGRWSQQDPKRGKLSDPMTLNRYLYVSDDPVNFTDPSGKDALGCLKDAITAIAAFLGTVIAFVVGAIIEKGAAASLETLELGGESAAAIAAAEIAADTALAVLPWLALLVIIAVIAAALVIYISCVLQH